MAQSPRSRARARRLRPARHRPPSSPSSPSNPASAGPTTKAPAPSPTPHWVATVLVALANELLAVIAAYRDALDREHQGRLRRRDDDPF